MRRGRGLSPGICINQGHEVKIAASGRAFPYLSQFFPDVEEIWGLSSRSSTARSTSGARSPRTCASGCHGVPEDWHRGVADREAVRARAGRHRLRGLRLPVRQAPSDPRDLGRQHPDGRPLLARRRRCCTGLRRDYLASRSFVAAKLPRAQPLPRHHLLLAADPQASHHAGAVAAARRGAGGDAGARRAPAGLRADQRDRRSAALQAERGAGAPVRRARRRDRRRARRATCSTGRSRTRRSSTTCAPAAAWSARPDTR